MMMRIIPGITQEDWEIFTNWLEEESVKEERCVINYKDLNSARRDIV